MRALLYLLWVLPPLALWVLAHSGAAPQLLISAQYRGSSSAPIYTSCTYLGLHGFVTRPAFGACAWLRLEWEDGR